MNSADPAWSSYMTTLRQQVAIEVAATKATLHFDHQACNAHGQESRPGKYYKPHEVSNASVDECGRPFQIHKGGRLQGMHDIY